MTGGGRHLLPGIRRWAMALGLAAGLLFAAAIPGAAQGVGPDEVLADPKLETRARALSKRLRCLVCQNQSIDDSNAPLARDLRILVRERIKAGDGDDEVIAFLTRRYGDFVLLKPPVKPKTWGLWFGPLAVLALAIIVILFALRARRHRVEIAPTPLSPAERARLTRILEGEAREDAGEDTAGDDGRERRP